MSSKSDTPSTEVEGCVSSPACCLTGFLTSLVKSSQMYWASYILLGCVMIITQFFAPPVIIQMVLYTFPTIYIGSHLSLHQKSTSPESGIRQLKTEPIKRQDAFLFPLCASGALLTLYLAYKFCSAYWVNLLLTLYLSIFGCFALGETLLNVLEKVTPETWNATFSIPWNIKFPPSVAQWISSVTICQTVSYLMSLVVCISWLSTKHWTLHNIFATGFAIQGIRIVSVGSFKVSLILLTGLFFYDIFWVFGTDVMITVAKSFEGPAKIIFPVSHSPWKQSILGLGDIVLPGIFIAMILRFDHHLASLNQKSSETSTEQKKQTDVDIHQPFRKFYFWWNMIAYEAGLLATGLIMLLTRHPQPALLYLVPFCFCGLLGPGLYKREISEIFQYSEEEEEKIEPGKEENVVELSEKKEN